MEDRENIRKGLREKMREIGENKNETKRKKYAGNSRDNRNNAGK